MAATVEISAREAEVLALVGEHFSNAEIGARLFISVRTVESHVSSLLRKLEVPDRRALAQRASDRPRADQQHPAPVLPTPLTSFVGRARERAELTEMITKHRQVTAVGPGGVGKTRLALSVAAQIAGEFSDGVWFVDLVPITSADTSVVAGTVALALGLGEQPGRAMDETVPATLADRRALLVLDNCEHVRDGVAPFIERLLATCPGVTVLATSRARLMVPFERVYAVPPMSLSGEGASDAVELFMDRAAAGGWPPNHALRDDVAAFCARLDGVALAIELAAARWTTLGLDGLEAGLSDQLRMLAGGPRTEDRHRSVRAALDWSHALLEPDDRVLLRRVSVFMKSFTVAAAAQVAASERSVVADGLARLAEQSLLVVTASPSGTAYRALETIRQYGMERLTEAGELDDIRSRHLSWCLAAAAELAVVGTDWRPRFDAVADDFRAAMAWAGDRPQQRADAGLFAQHLAQLCFTRNLIGESQMRYEQAAALADNPATATSMLRHAACAAGCQMRGDDMHRLRRAAADAALRSGDRAGAARDLATAAADAYRFASKFVRPLPSGEAAALITEAQQLAGDDPAAQAAVALAETGRALTDALTGLHSPEDAAAHTIERAEQAVELAHRTGDPLAESAALDTLAGAHSLAGDTFAAADVTRRRMALLESTTNTPAGTHELIDALGEAAEAELGTGDLRGARRWARQLADHALLAEVGHRATSWLLVTDALAGNVDEVLTHSVRFLDAWQRAGNPAKSVLGPAVAGVAMIHNLRGDHDAWSEWDAALHRFDTPPAQTHGYGAVFDALAMLHRGQISEALGRLAAEPGEVWRWVTWIWLHWYVALRAEAAVLAGVTDAGARLAEARTIVAGNPVAGAIVERAEALHAGDRQRLLATAAAFDAAGCRYQSARTEVLAGGDHAARGAAALADLGLAPMAPLVP
ncbi:ATP-binding protein [Nocardia gamkensis]|uniref:ATPase n=1 Tax=Nocardia gamkensis TaxID=352869 RepID=A0A7X6L1U0_9NOCA|nr:LuxR C-terminal-related transcriptional regulator [Nocardia gamkensis]NKY26089.1 ATPase [Nocardia gamkensis]